jgi:hypothetical protein
MTKESEVEKTAKFNKCFLLGVRTQDNFWCDSWREKKV